MSDPKEDYSKEEAKRRFEQAIRGARITGHKPMKDVLRQKPKKQPKSGEKAKASQGSKS